MIGYRGGGNEMISLPFKREVAIIACALPGKKSVPLFMLMDINYCFLCSCLVVFFTRPSETVNKNDKKIVACRTQPND